MFRFSTLNVSSFVVFAISLIFFNCFENNFLLLKQWWVISKSKIQIENEKRLENILLIDICIISMWIFDVEKIVKLKFVVKMFFFARLFIQNNEFFQIKYNWLIYDFVSFRNRCYRKFRFYSNNVYCRIDEWCNIFCIKIQ